MGALSVGVACVVCAIGTTGPATAVARSSEPVEQVDIAALNRDLIHAVQKTLDALDPVLVEQHGIYGLHRVDWDNKAIVVYLTDSRSTPAAQKAIKTAAASVRGGVDVQFRTAPVTIEKLDKASQQLFASRAEWAQDPSAVYYTYPDVPNATIHVGLGSLAAVGGDLSAEAKTLSGDTFQVEYTVEPGPPPTFEAGSRLADQGGWTGGNWLGRSQSTVPTVTNSDCGLGFTWRRWSDNELMGGTAEHCINARTVNCSFMGLSFPNLYHNRRHLGTAVATDPGSDSALLLRAVNTSFNATAWMGGPATTVEREVKGIRAVEALGDVVVLSGPRNGPAATETHVMALRLTTCAGPKTVTRDYVSTAGDSGAPWLTTFSNGTVRAHGQHSGYATWLGATRSMYTPVTHTSSRLEASIAIAP
jgi:hypothetical protein